MHAVLVNVKIEPDRGQEGQEHLEANVVPRTKETPGFVSGYWTRSADGKRGSSMVIFESEEAAKAAAQMIPNLPRPEFISFDSIEVGEVVAQA
jgi:heme-degrading monooxygenase HmoA